MSPKNNCGRYDTSMRSRRCDQIMLGIISAKKMVDNGMQLVTPPPAMMADLRKRSAHLVDDFMKKVPASQAPIKAYLAELKRT